MSSSLDHYADSYHQFFSGDAHGQSSNYVPFQTYHPVIAGRPTYATGPGREWAENFLGRVSIRKSAFGGVVSGRRSSQDGISASDGNPISQPRCSALFVPGLTMPRIDNFNKPIAPMGQRNSILSRTSAISSTGMRQSFQGGFALTGFKDTINV